MTREDELKKVQAERDQMLKDLHGNCEVCVYAKTSGSMEPCKDCGILGKNWVWRGIQESERT